MSLKNSKPPVQTPNHCRHESRRTLILSNDSPSFLSSRRLVVLALLCLALFLSLTNLLLSIKLSDVGFKLQASQQHLDALQLDVDRLQSQINRSSSLTHIRAQTMNLGFVTEYQAIVLPETLPVAYHQ